MVSTSDEGVEGGDYCNEEVHDPGELLDLEFKGPGTGDHEGGEHAYRDPQIHEEYLVELLLDYCLGSAEDQQKDKRRKVLAGEESEVLLDHVEHVLRLQFG